MSVRLLFVHALSPLHAGTGQSVGAIELAIARDRATNFPYLPGSSLKGSLRAKSEANKSAKTVSVFGPETARASDHAGALVIGDANLLLLPVRSVAGTFAWVTSPYLLARFARDLAEAGKGKLPALAPAVDEIVLSTTTKLEVSVSGAKRVIFEDLDLKPVDTKTASADSLAILLAPLLFPGDTSWQTFFKERLAVVHDDVMTYLSEHATDVVARVALKDDTKTVANLWHEESLPVESILVALALSTPNDKTKLDKAQIFAELATLCAGSIQLGGKATVGRGRCRLVLAN